MLDFKLKPLDKYMSRRGLVELRANQPGELWLEIDGEGSKAVKTPELDTDFWEGLARALSNELNILDFWKKPYLRASLPGGHRLQLVMGRTVASGLGVSIRIKRSIDRTLEDFGATSDQAERIAAAVKAKKNILVSGGMFSGKTTLLRVIAQMLPRGDRLVTVEDNPELDPDHMPDRVEFIVNPLGTDEDISYKDVLDALTRLRPDRIWVGELNLANTWILLRVLNLGHGGLGGTIHANSPRMALRACVQNCEFAGYPAAAARAAFADTLDMIIQVHRIEGTYRRQITDIWELDHEQPDP